MSSLSTHVLDAVTGSPAEGVRVTLSTRGESGWSDATSAVTDADGRIGRLADELPTGTHRLTFDTGAYFAASGTTAFYPEVVVAFVVDEERHVHVPLLLSPFAYSTYRGS